MAHQLRARGFQAAALTGGWTAWKAAYPVEPASGAQVAATRDEGW